MAIVTEACARHLDRGTQRIDRRVLSEDHELEVPLQVREHFAIRCRDVLCRNARNPCDHRLDVGDIHGGLALCLWLEPQRGACLIDHVDRLVRQVAIIDVTLGELGCSHQRVIRISDSVMLLEAGLESAQDLDRLRDGGLDHVDLLEAPRQSMVLFENPAIFLVSGRADAAELAARKHGLDEV